MNKDKNNFYRDYSRTAQNYKINSVKRNLKKSSFPGAPNMIDMDEEKTKVKDTDLLRPIIPINKDNYRYRDEYRVDSVKYEKKKKEKILPKILRGVLTVMVLYLAAKGIIWYGNFLNERDEKLIENADEIIAAYNAQYPMETMKPTPTPELYEILPIETPVMKKGG